jgi:proline-specific peptidase
MVVQAQLVNIGKLQTPIFQMRAFNTSIMTSWDQVRVRIQMMNDYGNVDRFVEEVEQVRIALGLDASNFIILGHSWGGILGLEYAIKYQENLKGLIISNMVSSIPDYIDYANEVLGPQLPEEVLKTIKFYEQKEDYTNPEYLGLIEEYYYPKHVLRMRSF